MSPAPVAANSLVDRTFLRFSGWLLKLPMPLFQRLGLAILLRQARKDSPEAAGLILRLLDGDSRPSIKTLAARAVAGLDGPAVLSAAWQYWYETRGAALREILRAKNRVAAGSPLVKALSSLDLSPDPLLFASAEDELVEPLVRLSEDPDPSLSSRAAACLLHLKRPAAINRLCEIWVETRLPALRQILLDAGYTARRPPAVRLLSLLLKGDLSAVLSAGPEMVQPLAAALNDPDLLLAERACQCLPALQDPEAILELCAIWLKERTPELEKAILQARYLPERTGAIRLLIALKLGRIDAAGAASPELVDILLSASQDADPVIQDNAWKALALVSQDCKDALCQKVIATEDPLALRVCLAGGFLPQLPEKCAAYLFISEQWSEYKAFDFDQHLVRLLVETSPPEFRQRIARKIQSSGQTEFLSILSRADIDDGSRPISLQDAKLFLRLLSDNRDYPRIWELILQFTPAYASRALKILAVSSWRPEQPDALELFRQLCRLLEKPIEYDPAILVKLLPFALPVETVRAPGRINSIAFDPHAPRLAVGTGQGVVVLWNYQQAKIDRVLRIFKHSIGQLLFMPGGELICAEKTSAKAVCQVYSVRDGQVSVLGRHTGSVTSVTAIGEQRILTAGRDGKIKILEITGRDPLSETQFPAWPRSVCTNHARSLVALLADSVSFLELPHLELATGQPYKRLRMTDQPPSQARSGCFSPDDAYLITVQFNGHVGIYAEQDAEKIQHSALAGQDGPVSRAAFLPDHDILLLGEVTGEVNCRAWPSLGLVSSFRAPSGRLTSMQVSSDGAFIATGNDESSVTLWDLRLSRLPDLVTRPLSSLTSADMAWIGSLMRLPGLPEQGADLLQFIWAVLQYRFRYDIQLEEAVSIRPGDFDILLD